MISGGGYNSIFAPIYCIFAPFVGKDIYQYVAIGVYSFLDFSCFLGNTFSTVILFSKLIFQALSVFILYVRCTAIDPADPGILLVGGEDLSAYKSQNADFPGNQLYRGLGHHSFTVTRSSSCVLVICGP